MHPLIYSYFTTIQSNPFAGKKILSCSIDPKKEALLCSIENQSDWLINIQPMEILFLNYRCRSIQVIPFVNSRRQS
jgi:hypothetical protein